MLAAHMTGPVRSRRLSPEVEDELRIDVMDGQVKTSDTVPKLIIGNDATGCHAVMYNRAAGMAFAFHHGKMQFATECRCLIRHPAEGDEDAEKEWRELSAEAEALMTTLQCHMEGKFAAMVLIKLVLGMKVPESLRPETLGAKLQVEYEKQQLELLEEGFDTDGLERRAGLRRWRNRNADPGAAEAEQNSY
jgi:hypothetical protein